MAPNRIRPIRSTVRPLVGIGSRATSLALKPLRVPVDMAAEAGASIGRQAAHRVLDSHELERLSTRAANDDRVQVMLRNALDSEATAMLVTTFFDSGLVDLLVDRLLSSEALWKLIDEVAASPSVTAAISHQGFGLADQVAGQVRSRSRNADDWLERAARRVTHVKPRTAPAQPSTGAL